jgi:Cu/Ag efflux pump CusA
LPMAISLAWGVLFATVITLILVPCLYIIIEDFAFSKRDEEDLSADERSNYAGEPSVQ